MTLFDNGVFCFAPNSVYWLPLLPSHKDDMPPNVKMTQAKQIQALQARVAEQERQLAQKQQEIGVPCRFSMSFLMGLNLLLNFS